MEKMYLQYYLELFDKDRLSSVIHFLLIDMFIYISLDSDIPFLIDSKRKSSMISMVQKTILTERSVTASVPQL